jgi:hypothetical protein
MKTDTGVNTVGIKDINKTLDTDSEIIKYGFQKSWLEGEAQGYS